MDETNTNIIEFVDENDETVQFEHVMTISYDDRDYIVLKVLENEDPEEDEVIIMRIESDEKGEEVYKTIDDEDEQQEVFDAFLEILDSQEEEE
jgi:hypothetical protein